MSMRSEWLPFVADDRGVVSLPAGQAVTVVPSARGLVTHVSGRFAKFWDVAAGSWATQVDGHLLVERRLVSDA